MPQNNILRLRHVITKTGLSKSTIYTLLSEGKFPARIQLSSRSIGFSEIEVDNWIAEKLSNRA
jgi:prophage regulatory protein